MPDSYTQGPSLADIARRLQRVEDKLDERIATVDMLRSSEKLFEAREISHNVSVQALEARIKVLEEARNRLQNMLIAAFLGILGQGIVLLLTATGGH